MTDIPEREHLVHDNPDLAAQIREGIAQAERGETVNLGSFSQYLDADAPLFPAGTGLILGHFGEDDAAAHNLTGPLELASPTITEATECAP